MKIIVFSVQYVHIVSATANHRHSVPAVVHGLCGAGYHRSGTNFLLDQKYI